MLRPRHDGARNEADEETDNDGPDDVQHMKTHSCADAHVGVSSKAIFVAVGRNAGIVPVLRTKFFLLGA